jgi:pimeloyl-ACP methyl ester carboxylesterase
MPATSPDEYLVRFTDTDQGRMRSRTLGAPHDPAPPVVAVMGMAVSEYLLPALGRLTAWTQAHLVDLPGLAGSGPAAYPLDVRGYAAAVATWLDDADLPPVVLIGHSSSTQVVAHVAEVLRLYLDGTEPYWAIHLPWAVFSGPCPRAAVAGAGRVPGGEARRGDRGGRGQLPHDLGATSRFKPAFASLPARHPLPPSLPIADTDGFVNANPGRWPVQWRCPSC